MGETFGASAVSPSVTIFRISDTSKPGVRFLAPARTRMRVQPTASLSGEEGDRARLPDRDGLAHAEGLDEEADKGQGGERQGQKRVADPLSKRTARVRWMHMAGNATSSLSAVLLSTAKEDPDLNVRGVSGASSATLAAVTFCGAAAACREGRRERTTGSRKAATVAKGLPPGRGLRNSGASFLVGRSDAQ